MTLANYAFTIKSNMTPRNVIPKIFLSVHVNGNQLVQHWQLVKMNITISKEYLENVLGEELLNKFLTVFSINTAIQKYLIPWMATITVVINSMVCIMCLGIYIKTKGKNHRPAFVFIFFLNFVDVLLGMYVKKNLK